MCASALYWRAESVRSAYPNLLPKAPGQVPGSFLRNLVAWEGLNMRNIIILVWSTILTANALAQVVETPQCRADLARASDLVDQIAARDRAGPIADPTRLCAALRLNAGQMHEARDAMQRCLRGHAQRENVGQMDASLDDIASVLTRRCRNL